MKQEKSLQNIVCIGGGTGTFVALKGLKEYTHNLSAIVSMSDSGGSNKRIRDEFGLLPTSDIRQCFVALSDENGGSGLLRQLFMYRFEKGTGISGMTFGNLFMAALTDIVGSQSEAIRQTGKVLRIKGSVIPVSFTNTDLYAEYEDGHIEREEHRIDEPRHDGRMKITRLYLRPSATPNPEALKAIARASLIVLGPGDLYTSLLPSMLVEGIAQAIRRSRAKKVYVVNLMTRWGQTYDFSAKNHIEILERYIGKSLDYVLINNKKLPKETLETYARYHEHPVRDDLGKKAYYTIIRSPIVGEGIIKKQKSDMLARSLIRHDSALLGKSLIPLA